jgi:hypothetical protein
MKMDPDTRLSIFFLFSSSKIEANRVPIETNSDISNIYFLIPSLTTGFRRFGSGQRAIAFFLFVLRANISPWLHGGRSPGGVEGSQGEERIYKVAN